MDGNKTFQFKGTADTYVIVFLVSLVGGYIPIFGWAWVLNYVSKWVADNSTVNGKQVVYHAEYSETLNFVAVNTLYIFITLGIYIFWFVPKLYKYMAAHLSFAGEEPVVAAAPAEAAFPAPAQ